MGRRIEIGGASKAWAQYVVAGLVTAMVLWGVLALVSAIIGRRLHVSIPALVLLGTFWLGVTIGWVRVARARAPENSGSVWDAIPNRQYTGRYAEAGGLARDSWEKALDQLPDEEHD